MFELPAIPDGCNVLFDLDRTLAHYEEWEGPERVGSPIPRMVELAKRYLEAKVEVRIFTARCFPLKTIWAIEPDDLLDTMHKLAEDDEPTRKALASVKAIRSWCREHLGQVLTITCVKDPRTFRIYDDLAVGVQPNTGELSIARELA